MTESRPSLSGPIPNLEAAQREGFPRGVCDPYCASEHRIETTVDRRMLWHLESAMAISATNDHLRDERVRLCAYLRATCEHHWHVYDGDSDFGPHKQCLWCNDVIFAAEPAPKGTA